MTSSSFNNASHWLSFSNVTMTQHHPPFIAPSSPIPTPPRAAHMTLTQDNIYTTYRKQRLDFLTETVNKWISRTLDYYQKQCWGNEDNQLYYLSLWLFHYDCCRLCHCWLLKTPTAPPQSWLYWSGYSKLLEPLEWVTSWRHWMESPSPGIGGKFWEKYHSGSVGRKCKHYDGGKITRKIKGMHWREWVICFLKCENQTPKKGKRQDGKPALEKYGDHCHHRRAQQATLWVWHDYFPWELTYHVSIQTKM